MVIVKGLVVSNEGRVTKGNKPYRDLQVLVQGAKRSSLYKVMDFSGVELPKDGKVELKVEIRAYMYQGQAYYGLTRYDG